MKKTVKHMRAVSYHFERVEPGEVVSKEVAEDGARRLSRVVINPSSYNQGMRFAGISAGAFTHENSDAGNPTPLPPEMVAAGVPVKLFLANHGEQALFPSAVVIMEIL